jgi:hypothetical protein
VDLLGLLATITIAMGSRHSWAPNIKNVAPQKQNAICKTRVQYAKRNCAFELFKAHCAATINAKNASFHEKILKRKKCNGNFINKIFLSNVKFIFIVEIEPGSLELQALVLTTTL